MSIREVLSKKPKIVAILSLLVIAVALYASVSSIRSDDRRSYKPPESAYFTCDDGKTYFADDITKVAPFKTADGKEAVEAIVYSFDGGKDPFVAYMMRYPPEAKKAMEAAYGRSTLVGGVRRYASMEDRDLLMLASNRAEVKRTGDSKWVNCNAAEYAKIVVPECPKSSPLVKNMVLLRP